MSVPFDPRPLSEPVDGATARAFRTHLSQTGRLPSGSGATVVIVVVALAVVLLVGGGIVTTVFAALVTGLDSPGSVPPLLLFAVVPVVFFAGVGALVFWLVRSGRARQAATWVRLDRFARANGMTFEPARTDPPLPGMIFSQGSSRVASDLVRGDRPRFVEFANYKYTTGSGKNQQTHTWGYVAVHLSTPLPHIVLDAVGNNGLFGSNLPVTFSRDQHLSLEGDFDRYFRLSCPRGYERDALYLFTPDIMARFVDHAAALDVEIVDDWLFFYGKRDFSTLDPATWAWLFGAVAAMIDKLSQWERWRDDRAGAEPAASVAAVPAPALPVAAPNAMLRPPPGVAEPGRRLRRSVPWPAVVLIVVVAVLAVGVPFISVVAGVLSSLP